jgi:hydroxymethyl cephem carbamoyltransferase
MLILGFKPGHDGCVAAVQDRVLLHSLESEKDSGLRHEQLTPSTLLALTERLDAVPDVIAFGGWHRDGRLGEHRMGVGYGGIDNVEHRTVNFMGKDVTLFSSSHERSHLLMSVGMAPRDDFSERVVLTWEGAVGSFYLLDEHYRVTRHLGVVDWPGWRYGMLFAIADPKFAPEREMPRHEDSGKLMALAAFGDPEAADGDVTALVDDLLETRRMPFPKRTFRDSRLYNIGVEAEATKIAAALITERIFDRFVAAAREHIPAGLPLHISGGCGLNCDWNRMWRDLGHFSSVFVPPCTNDAGSALGTAIDALGVMTGDPYVDWSVYCGLEFEWDGEPDEATWTRREMDVREVADALADGRVFAWVQGRYEMGPRALGNRSLLADPTHAATRDRLNDIKQREGYRPIAPCCRVEDLAQAFDTDFEDPYMLYFRLVRSPDLAAVTHVDGSARCQTVSRSDNEPLHDLLSAVAARSGLGVLCNTSLNFKGLGFINRMSDLAQYCEVHGVDDMVVGDAWFERRDRTQPATRQAGAEERLGTF